MRARVRVSSNAIFNACVAFFGIATLALPSRALAQDAAACRDGYDRSQVLRDGGKLVDAQKLLRTCSSASCSAFVQRECTGWLADVEARLPSVVLAAKDPAGGDLVDVAVTIDGAPGPRRLDGRAMSLDPGEHTFAFSLASGEKAEKHLLLREGEKDTVVAVTLGKPLPPAALSGSVPAVVDQPSPTSPTSPPPPPSISPVRIAGFAVGGLGVAGIIVGAIAGAEASSKLSAPQCDTTAKLCDPGTLSSARSAATVSTVGFVAGGILVAGGVGMVIFAPRTTASGASDPKAARLRATPMIAAGGGGLSLGGVW